MTPDGWLRIEQLPNKKGYGCPKCGAIYWDEDRKRLILSNQPIMKVTDKSVTGGLEERMRRTEIFIEPPGNCNCGFSP